MPLTFIQGRIVLWPFWERKSSSLARLIFNGIASLIKESTLLEVSQISMQTTKGFL